MSGRLSVCLLLAVLAPGSLPAAEVQGLYEAQVPVLAKDSATQGRAITEALRLVLVKVSGDRNITERSGVEALLQNARNYVQQFGYRQSLRLSNAAAQRPPLFLWALFDQRALDRALRQAAVPTWGRERPTLLVWLVLDEAGNRRLIGGDPSPYASGLQAQAAARGLPLLLPLLDLEDEMQLQPADVWEGLTDKIIAASHRYAADAVLACALTSPQPGSWEGRWTLYAGGEIRPWSSRGEQPEAVLTSGVDGAADLLATQLAGPVARARLGDRVQLEIHEIRNVDQYARAQRYLRTLNSVFSVNVTRIEADRVGFALRARGGAQTVTQAIALGHTLEPLSLGAGSYRLWPE